MRVVMPLRKPVLVTSTDWLKLVGIATFLIDHIGLFFIDDDEIWRVIGRLAAPIFFFFIGFARSRTIPLSWILWGVVLSGIDWWMDGDSEFALNILLNFALIRVALRAVDGWASTPTRLALLMVVCLALTPFAGEVFEYGAEGWLWAIFGYAQRAFREGPAATGAGSSDFAKPRVMFALVAAATYSIAEMNGHDIEGLAAVVMIGAILLLTVALLLFNRRISPFQPPPVLAPAIVWVSRYSLHIYAISLFLMQDIIYVFD